jgi:hypothetical protein
MVRLSHKMIALICKPFFTVILRGNLNVVEICQGPDWGGVFPTLPHGLRFVMAAVCYHKAASNSLRRYLQPWPHIPCPENLRILLANPEEPEILPRIQLLRT